MKFSEKLQKLRKERGWSQEELAGMITVSRQAVSKWELGMAVPDTENILQLSELFGVSTDYLIKDSCESDEDIPAVVRTAEKVRVAERRHRYFATGIILLVLGIITAGVLFTLSQVIVSKAKVIYGPQEQIVEITPDGTTLQHDSGRTVTSYEPTYGFIPFLNTYYLHWVLAIGIVLIISGTVCLIKHKRAFKK